MACSTVGVLGTGLYNRHGALSIYWVVMYWRSREYWKDLGWKMRYYYLPTFPVFILGMYLSIQQYFIKGIEWFINKYMFNI